MKRTVSILALVLVLLLAGACGRNQGNTQQPEGVKTTLRIVDGAETGALILAGEKTGEVYTLNAANLSIFVDGKAVSADGLKDGMLLNIYHSGSIMESYPARFSEVYSIHCDSGDTDDACGLYLKVMQDLWEGNRGLQSGTERIAVDVSGLSELSEGEKSGLIHAVGDSCGFPAFGSTWKELKDGGYIDENLTWMDGCFFSVSGDADSFDAQIWRSGTGAYFYNGCKGSQGSDGSWSYKVGSEAIA